MYKNPTAFTWASSKSQFEIRAALRAEGFQLHRACELPHSRVVRQYNNNCLRLRDGTGSCSGTRFCLDLLLTWWLACNLHRMYFMVASSQLMGLARG